MITTDQPEPVKPSREDVGRVLYGQFTSNRAAEWDDIDDNSDEPRSGYLAAADAVLALLPAIPGQNPAELAAHDAEVAAKALEDAAAHVHGFAEDRFDDARGEGFSASFTSPDYQRGRAYEQACLWLRARAAAIRAEAQR